MPAPVVAAWLLNKLLVAHIGGQSVAGRIVEVEAYDQDDPASHTFRGRTERNSVMFGPAGHLYVYLSYGIHHCANVVTGADGRGDAVLIRAIDIVDGIDTARARRGRRADSELGNGPGKLCQAMGIDLAPRWTRSHRRKRGPRRRRRCGSASTPIGRAANRYHQSRRHAVAISDPDRWPRTMKPPICEVCDERFDPSEGELVRFLADDRSTAWRETSERDGRVGHPPDEAWFCANHAAVARSAALTSTLGQALSGLRRGASDALRRANEKGDAPSNRGEAGVEAVPSTGGSSGPPIQDSDVDSGLPGSADAAGTAQRSKRPWMPDDHRTVVIHPMSVDALARRLERFFDDVIGVCSVAAGESVHRNDDETTRTVRQYESPEWREKGPASEEVQTTTAVRIGAWECWTRRSRHDWLHGGLIQSSVSVGVTDAAAARREMSVFGGSHGNDSITKIGVSGSNLTVTAELLDALLDELRC